MDALVLIIEIVLCLFSLFMVAVVLLQSGKSAGLSGDIAGGAESFLGKSKAKSYEGTLKKLTKVAAVGIMVLAVVLVLIQVYVMPSDEETVESDTTTVEASSTPQPLQAADDEDISEDTDSVTDTEDTSEDTDSVTDTEDTSEDAASATDADTLTEDADSQESVE